jgi:hypothetical protein
MNSFIDGAILMEFLVAALFFLRFWKRSGDRFFLLFAIAFMIMAINRGALTWLTPGQQVPSEAHVTLYSVRLLAFLVLLIAIIDKNRTGAKRP